MDYYRTHPEDYMADMRRMMTLAHHLQELRSTSYTLSAVYSTLTTEYERANMADRMAAVNERYMEALDEYNTLVKNAFG